MRLGLIPVTRVIALGVYLELILLRPEPLLEGHSKAF